MDNSGSEENKEGLKLRSLEWHNRMARLFVEDRLAFERERKKLFDEFFNSIENEEERRRLRSMQASFDKKMTHAGSSHNRFVLAQTIFWDHFYEVWQPAVHKINTLLQSFVKKADNSTKTTRMATVYNFDKYRMPR